MKKPQAKPKVADPKNNDKTSINAGTQDQPQLNIEEMLSELEPSQVAELVKSGEITEKELQRLVENGVLTQDDLDAILELVAQSEAEEGQVDENGNPIEQVDEEGNPIQQVDEEGNPIQPEEPQVDENGNPLPQDEPQVDENGNPIEEEPQVDENGNPIESDQLPDDQMQMDDQLPDNQMQMGEEEPEYVEPITLEEYDLPDHTLDGFPMPRVGSRGIIGMRQPGGTPISGKVPKPEWWKQTKDAIKESAIHRTNIQNIRIKRREKRHLY